MCCVWSGMADVFTSEQAERIDILLKKYTNCSDRRRRAIIARVKDLIEEYISFNYWLLFDDEFKDGVKRRKFFVRFINVITGTKGPKQITEVNSRIIHFTWHYGIHHNTYRIKCHANLTGPTLQWQLQKITDYQEEYRSGSETEDEGMKYHDKYFQEDDDDEWDDDWDEGLHSNLNNQSNSMHTIISTVESMHERLCKLGV